MDALRMIGIVKCFGPVRANDGIDLIVGQQEIHCLLGENGTGKSTLMNIDVYKRQSHGHAICANCGNVFKDIYQDRLGAEIDCYTVWTSTATAGAMRGYGIPQAAFLSECLTDCLLYTSRCV